VKRVIVIVAVLVVVLVAGVAAAITLLGDGSPAGVEKGDCINDLPKSDGGTFKDADVVDCTATDGRFKVLGTFTDQKRTADSTPCKTFESAAGESLMTWYSVANNGETGEVLCVAMRR
jgi:hypothetical protein